MLINNRLNNWLIDWSIIDLLIDCLTVSFGSFSVVVGDFSSALKIVNLIEIEVKMDIVRKNW